MSDLLTHKQWMHLTHGGFSSIRSKELKAVDDALARYEKTRSVIEKEALTAALLRWMQLKGAGWKTSVRNKNQGIEILYRQLTGTDGAGLTGMERVGLSHIRDESRAIVQDLFLGKRLQWRSGFAKKLAGQKWGVRMNVRGVVQNGNTLSGGALADGIRSLAPSTGDRDGLARDLIDTVVPPEIRADVMVELAKVMPDFMKELATSLTPFVGVIVSGAGAVWNGKNALRGQWRMEWASYHITGSLSHAEPAAALNALLRILERERNADIYSFSVSIGEFTGKLAGALADGGTATNAAIGLAANVAKLLSIIRFIVRDVLERNAANRMMQSRIDIKIFETCPVVGAYLICCAPASVLVNTIFEDRFGKTGWQSQVEHALKHHLNPLKAQAKRVIAEHRFWIPELHNNPGLAERNKKKLAEMLKNKGKTGMEGFGSDAFAAEA